MLDKILHVKLNAAYSLPVYGGAKKKMHIDFLQILRWYFPPEKFNKWKNWDEITSLSIQMKLYLLSLNTFYCYLLNTNGLVYFVLPQDIIYGSPHRVPPAGVRQRHVMSYTVLLKWILMHSQQDYLCHLYWAIRGYWSSSKRLWLISALLAVDTIL